MNLSGNKSSKLSENQSSKLCRIRSTASLSPYLTGLQLLAAKNCDNNLKGNFIVSKNVCMYSQFCPIVSNGSLAFNFIILES